MVQFTEPWLLLLALAVPVAVWLWLRRGRATLRYPTTWLFSALPDRRSRMAVRFGAGLRGVILLLIVAAMSGPRIADWRSRVPAEGISIMLLLDVSGSMQSKDFVWDGNSISRLDAARHTIELFVKGGATPGGENLEGRPNDLIGMVTFATWPDSLCPLTLSHDVLLSMMNGQEVRDVPGESDTNISDAVAIALHRLEAAPTRRKVLVLISDGEHNCLQPSSNLTPKQTAQLGGNLTVPIYTVDCGGDGVDDDTGKNANDNDLRSKLRASAKNTMQNLASISHGRYFQAHDTEALVNVCREIDRMEKMEIKSYKYRQSFEAYPWLGLGAFGFLFLLQVLELTIWRRLP